MKAVRIGFEGYKRLAMTACNTDARILAFVGSNESGKSSMLDALVWLTNGEDDPLPEVYANRGREVRDASTVVEATYELDGDDLALLRDLDMDQVPTRFLVQKRKDGGVGSDALPNPRRAPAPFRDAAAKVDATQRKSTVQFALAVDETDEDSETVNDLTSRVLTALADPDTPWSEQAQQDAEFLIEWLSQPSTTNREGKPRDTEASRLLRVALGKARSKHPRDAARDRLLVRVPKFVLFREEDRELSTAHEISIDAYRATPQPALANLLRVARLDLERLWRFISINDDSSRETMVDEANEALEDFFSQAWNQSRVSVRFKVAGSRLEVYLKELGRGGPTTNIEERSDGLRTFIALSAFLAAQEFDVAPTLLIDEAETHLHYDAQADLVSVLLKQVEATQVFYTTHSPGCLPADLGTGIRLLRRDPTDRSASSIRSDFWANEEPGFAPLLYAMGASAAAFSACRRAVLAEGAADMVLLPTLLRRANGLDDLDYQVAPGLSNANAYGMRVEEVAAQVVYLLDGDDAGRVYRRQLREAQVDEARIFSLPEGWASEDLVEREDFARVVSTLLPAGATVTAADLATGQPIVKSLEDWGAQAGVKIPGHVAIAYGLVNPASDLALSPQGHEVLVDLHAAITAAFDRG